jgi:hypothetical protein
MAHDVRICFRRDSQLLCIVGISVMASSYVWHQPRKPPTRPSSAKVSSSGKSVCLLVPVTPSPGADVAASEPSPGADVAGTSRVPVQMWQMSPDQFKMRKRRIPLVLVSWSAEGLYCVILSLAASSRPWTVQCLLVSREGRRRRHTYGMILARNVLRLDNLQPGLRLQGSSSSRQAAAAAAATAQGTAAFALPPQTTDRSRDGIRSVQSSMH